MPRTTLDIDGTVLAELRERGAREGKTLGQLTSELLAVALAQAPPAPAEPFKLITKHMGKPLVDLEDKEAVWAILDADEEDD
jgi:hypothetical protein